MDSEKPVVRSMAVMPVRSRRGSRAGRRRRGAACRPSCPRPRRAAPRGRGLSGLRRRGSAQAMNTSRGTTAAPFTSTGSRLEQAEVADRRAWRRRGRVAQRLVLHGAQPVPVRPRHGGQAAGGVERLERADRLGELDRLDLGQRVDLHRLAVAQHPRVGRVVVEHAVQRVDDLVVQRRLRILRQAADADAHGVRLVQRGDARGGQDVDHAGRQAAVRDDADVRRFPRLVVQLQLLEHDGRVAAQVAVVHALATAGA
jgi:hypothetical protein